MNRFAAVAFAAALSALPAIGPTAAPASDARALPMQFEYWQEGPSEACGTACRNWVSATGAITGDTPRDFEAFAKQHNLKGAMIALDSDGGSVLGALALGRAIRALGMSTTVGKTVDLGAADRGRKRGRLVPRAYCESMCAFVLLAGVERRVPGEARVLVHQIWLGDRRDDPTAANYSAEDLVLVQRDIGRLAQYTVEMGGAIDLLEIALKIPPWEPMRLLSREELRGMKMITADDAPDASSGATAGSLALASGVRAPINDRSWSIAANSDRPTLTRTHPLTVEGDDIGSFELRFACGEIGKDYLVTYVERRYASAGGRAPAPPTDVAMSLSGKTISLRVLSSEIVDKTRASTASGRVSLEQMRAFADSQSRSLTVDTNSDDTATTIRIGNAGVARSLPQLAASCGGSMPSRRSARSDWRRGG